MIKFIATDDGFIRLDTIVKFSVEEDTSYLENRTNHYIACETQDDTFRLRDNCHSKTEAMTWLISFMKENNLL